MASADMDDLIFGEICRCCMASKPRMKPLFDTNLFTMLNAVTGLNAHQNDGLPSQLCVPCVLQIRRSHFFKLQCESTDLTLRRYVVESKHLGLYDYDMPSRSTDKAKVKKEADSSLQNDPTGNEEDGESTKTLAQVKFHCPECSKEFTAERKLKRHMRIHFMDKPHFCTECDMSFVEKSNLTKHMRKHTGELRNSKAKPHLCCECGKSFKYSTSLSRHKRFHARRNLFTCTICSKSYVEQNSLDVHMRSHTNERPFGCSICDKHFAQKANLERHERIHTGEKPYRCDLCGKCFSQKSYLCIHKRIHSKEKPFECQDCHKCFISRNSLQKHQRKPCSAHPHRCNVCTKTFRFKKALRLHRQTHRLERPHACKMCEKRFMHATNLATHVKEKHPDGPVGSGDDEYQSEDQKPIVKENDGAPAKSDPLGQRTRKGQAKSLEDSSQEEYGFEDEEDEEEDVDEEEDEEEGEEEEEEDDEEDEEIEIDEDDGMCIIGVDAENMDMEDQSSDEEVVHVMYNGYTEQDEFTTIKQEPLLEIQIMNPGETNSDIEQ